MAIRLLNRREGDVTGKSINTSYRNFKVPGVISKLKIKKKLKNSYIVLFSIMGHMIYACYATNFQSCYLPADIYLSVSVTCLKNAKHKPVHPYTFKESQPA